MKSSVWECSPMIKPRWNQVKPRQSIKCTTSRRQSRSTPSTILSSHHWTEWKMAATCRTFCLQLHILLPALRKAFQGDARCLKSYQFKWHIQHFSLALYSWSFFCILVYLSQHVFLTFILVWYFLSGMKFLTVWLNILACILTPSNPFVWHKSWQLHFIYK